MYYITTTYNRPSRAKNSKAQKNPSKLEGFYHISYK